MLRLCGVFLFLMPFCCGFGTVRFGARALAWEVHICLSTGQALNRFSF